MKRIFFIIIFSLLFNVNIAIADDSNRSNLYLGMGGSLNFLKSNGVSKTGDIGLSINIGYNLNKYSAIEFREGTSLVSDASILLDNSMALYVKGKYSINKDLNSYVLAGYASTEVSSGFLNNAIKESGFTYGIGVDYKLSTSLSIYSDYTVLSPSVSQINFGVAYFYDNKGLANLPPDAPEVQSYKEKKAEEKLMKELRIKEKLEQKKKQEAIAKAKKEAEEKLKLPTIVKLNLLHKEDSKKPILVSFFELKSIESFKRMDYEELVNDEKKMLDGEIVSRSKEILKPGKMSTFEFNVKFDSVYYAVVAALNDVQSDDSWRYIIKVKPHEVNTVNLMLDHKKIMEFTK